MYQTVALPLVILLGLLNQFCSLSGMNLLLTGISGFLGRHVTAELSLAGCIQHVISRRPVSHPHLYSVIVHDFMGQGDLAGKMHRPVDAVVHMAHPMGGERQEQIDFAVKSTQALLDFALGHGVKNFVLVSSLSVFDLAALPAYALVGAHTPRLVLDESLPAYAAAKLMQELLVEQAVATGNINAVILRLGLIYDDRAMSNAYAGLIRNRIQLGLSHYGQIPLVNAKRAAQVIVESVSSIAQPGLDIRCVLDPHPWSMQQYRQALIDRGQLRPHGLSLPWWLIDRLCANAEKVARLTRQENKLPELFNPVSRSARLKPLLYWPES